jgi:PadR family transcriptional regulator
MSRPTDLVQGTLDLLILKTVDLQPMHGLAIAHRIRQLSGAVLLVQQGTLYPALHKLEQQGFVKSTWGESENKRRAKYYSLTRAGRKRLEVELQSWARLSEAITLVTKTSGT